MAFYFFDGIANWAHVQRPNKFGNWSVDLGVDKETAKAIKQTGIRANIKLDDEDQRWITFRRKTTLRKKSGEIVEMDPPEVTKDGAPFEGLIGNGSKVTVKIEVYDFDGGTDAAGQKYDGGKGARLVAVRVDELMEYKKDEGGNTKSSQSDMPF